MSRLFEDTEIVKQGEEGVLLTLWVRPRSGKADFGPLGERGLEVYLKKAPEKGKANQELIRLFQKVFHIPQSCVKILKGEKSRQKIILLKGMTRSEVEKRLNTLME